MFFLLFFGNARKPPLKSIGKIRIRSCSCCWESARFHGWPRVLVREGWRIKSLFLVRFWILTEPLRQLPQTPSHVPGRLLVPHAAQFLRFWRVRWQRSVVDSSTPDTFGIHLGRVLRRLVRTMLRPDDPCGLFRPDIL